VRILVFLLLGAFLAFDVTAADSNSVAPTNAAAAPGTNDPVEQAYQKILEDDDLAIADVTDTIQSNTDLEAKGQGMTPDALRQYIWNKAAPVRKEYEDFLQQHPDHVLAHIAFGSFLDDVRDEDGAKAEYETAVRLDPKNPAAWNNLANAIGHTGPVSNMFIYYAKAIELNPNEPVYYENLATCVYLYRLDGRAYYHFTNDQQIFDMSLDLYRKAFQIASNDFALATELAQTYYGITPVRTEDALNAWTNALKLAKTDLEQQGVYVHLARFKLNAGRFAESHADLDKVTQPSLAELKNRLLHNLALRENAEKPSGPPLRMTCPSGRTCELRGRRGYFRA
jgi:tetratricopeptide (TPR) repeat protein